MPDKPKPKSMPKKPDQLIPNDPVVVYCLKPPTQRESDSLEAVLRDLSNTAKLLGYALYPAYQFDRKGEREEYPKEWLDSNRYRFRVYDKDSQLMAVSNKLGWCLRLRHTYIMDAKNKLVFAYGKAPKEEQGQLMEAEASV